MNGIMSARYTELLYKFPTNNDRSHSWLKLKERDWKIRSIKVDAGNFKHELLNRLRSTMAVNVLKTFFLKLFTFTAFTSMHTSWPNYCFIYLVLPQVLTSGLDLDLSHHLKGPKFQMNMDSKCYVLWLHICHYAPTSLMCKGTNFQK